MARWASWQNDEDSRCVAPHCRIKCLVATILPKKGGISPRSARELEIQSHHRTVPSGAELRDQTVLDSAIVASRRACAQETRARCKMPSARTMKLRQFGT